MAMGRSKSLEPALVTQATCSIQRNTQRLSKLRQVKWIAMPGHRITSQLEYPETRWLQRVLLGNDSNRDMALSAGLLNSAHLSSKALNVLLLLVESPLSDEEGELAVLHVQLLDLCVKERLNALPDEVGTGAQNVAACTQHTYSVTAALRLSIHADNTLQCAQCSRTRILRSLTIDQFVPSFTVVVLLIVRT